MNVLTRIAAATVLAAASSAAVSAATLTDLGNADAVDPSRSLVADNFTVGPDFRVRVGSTPDTARDPFEFTDAAGTVPYYSLIRRNSPGSLTFDRTYRQLTFLWGSPDLYNTLTFLLNGVAQASFTGGSIADASSDLGRGADLVRITDVMFDEVQFATSQNAFEFSNVEAAIVPVPAAGVLLVGALGGLAAVRRRRKPA